MWIGCVWLLWVSTDFVHALGIDNKVSGPVNVTCRDNKVGVNFRTIHPFQGRVHVIPLDPDSNDIERDAPTPPIPNECSHDALVDHNGLITQTTSVQLLFNTDCVMLSDTASSSTRHAAKIIISFHSVFITSADMAIYVECNTNMGNTDAGGLKADLQTEMHVAPLATTESVYLKQSAPQCTYTLHRDNLNGPTVFDSVLGEAIYHKWTCTPTGRAFLVHTCVAKTDNQQAVTMVDPFGCVTDNAVATHLTYSGDGSFAYTLTSAFKFPRTSRMIFQCTIEICPENDTLCNTRTPPNCEVRSRKLRTLSSPPFSTEQQVVRTETSIRYTDSQAVIARTSTGLNTNPAVTLTILAFMLLGLIL